MSRGWWSCLPAPFCDNPVVDLFVAPPEAKQSVLQSTGGVLMVGLKDGENKLTALQVLSPPSPCRGDHERQFRRYGLEAAVPVWTGALADAPDDLLEAEGWPLFIVCDDYSTPFLNLRAWLDTAMSHDKGGKVMVN